jgi:hypothetical protein
MLGEETYRAWARDEFFRRPPASELARCPLAASFDVEARQLAGAVS